MSYNPYDNQALDFSVRDFLDNMDGWYTHNKIESIQDMQRDLHNIKKQTTSSAASDACLAKSNQLQAVLDRLYEQQ